jgi:L-fucose isomerase-like protein
MNRDFPPDQLVAEARADTAKIFENLGIKVIQLGESDSKFSGVETHTDAGKCAEIVSETSRSHKVESPPS